MHDQSRLHEGSAQALRERPFERTQGFRGQFLGTELDQQVVPLCHARASSIACAPSESAATLAEAPAARSSGKPRDSRLA